MHACKYWLTSLSLHCRKSVGFMRMCRGLPINTGRERKRVHTDGRSVDYFKCNSSKNCVLSKRFVFVSVLSYLFLIVCYSVYSVEAEGPSSMTPNLAKATLPTSTLGSLHHVITKWQAKELRSQIFSFSSNCKQRQHFCFLDAQTWIMAQKLY